MKQKKDLINLRIFLYIGILLFLMAQVITTDIIVLRLLYLAVGVLLFPIFMGIGEKK